MDFSRPDWEERLMSGRSIMPDLKLVNPELADRAVEIFNRLRIPDVVGQPYFGSQKIEWFLEVIRALFGSLDPVTRKRAIGEILLCIGKKNGKTTKTAALMLVALMLNERPNAEFLFISSTTKVASIAFSQVLGILRTDKNLERLFKIQNYHLKRITFLPTGSSLEVKTFSSEVLTGAIPTGVFLDEIHEIAQKSYAENVISQITGGLVSQPDGFLFITTTQSVMKPRGVFKNLLKRARGVRDGKIPGYNFLPLIYEFPSNIQHPDDLQPGQPAPWEDPKLWKFVVPGLGQTILPEMLETLFNKARQDSEYAKHLWASQHLNVEIGGASGSWSAARYWDRNRSKISLDDILERSEVVVAGIDGGGADDMHALAIVGRDRENPAIWYSWCRAWIFQSGLDQRPGNVSLYRDFEQDGDLVILDRPGRDIEEITAILQDIDQRSHLALIGFDPKGIATEVAALAAVGITEPRVCAVRQGYSLTGAIKTLERKLLDNTFTHGDQELLNWSVSNAVLDLVGNGVSISREASGLQKIDPLAALLNAIFLMCRNPKAGRNAEAELDYLLERGLLTA